KPAPRRDQLLQLLAATFGAADATGVEAALHARAKSLARDPLYGLVLHNASVYVDAQVFGLFAINLFRRGELNGSVVARLSTFAALEKALLLEVLTAVVSEGRKPALLGQRAILRQIKSLRLQEPCASDLRRNLSRNFKEPPSLQTLAEPVRSADLRRF